MESSIFAMACRIFNCGMWVLFAGSLVFACEHLIMAGDLVPWPGVGLDLLHWECRVLATGPPGTSQKWDLWRLSGSTNSTLSLYDPYLPVSMRGGGQLSKRSWWLALAFDIFLFWAGIFVFYPESLRPSNKDISPRPFYEEGNSGTKLGSRTGLINCYVAHSGKIIVIWIISLFLWSGIVDFGQK